LLCSLAAGAAERQTPVAGVRAAMDGFLEALNGLDLERIGATFADDVTAFVPSAQAQRVTGKAAVVEIFRAFVVKTRETTPRLSIVPEDVVVEAAPSLGVVSFQVRGSARTNRRTFVFRRTAGRWLISHFHASDVTS
jgi:ketosteroid isomerase-like protein